MIQRLEAPLCVRWLHEVSHGVDSAGGVRFGTRLERRGLRRRGCGCVAVVERGNSVHEDVRDNVGDEQLKGKRIAQHREIVAEPNPLVGIVVVEACTKFRERAVRECRWRRVDASDP